MNIALFRNGLWIAIVVALAAATLAFFLIRTPAGYQLGGGTYALVDDTGKPTGPDMLKGHPSLLFFGYTHCPDVCPTTLAAMTRVLEALGPRAAEVTAVFISVDPERDTPEELKTFGSLFDPRIVLLTGSPDEIAAVVRDYHIYAAKVPIEGGGYTMDHTASVQLYDRDSRFRSAFDFHEDDAVILDKVRLVLDGGG